MSNRSERTYAAETAQDEARRARMRAKAPRAHAALDLVHAALYAPYAGTRTEAVAMLEALVILLGGACDSGAELREEDAVDIYMFVQVATAPVIPAPEPPKALCVRWGSGATRCVRSFDHIGRCMSRPVPTTDPASATNANPAPVATAPAAGGASGSPRSVDWIFDRIARSH
jgi:hypothetical protein